MGRTFLSCSSCFVFVFGIFLFFIRSKLELRGVAPARSGHLLVQCPCSQCLEIRAQTRSNFPSGFVTLATRALFAHAFAKVPTSSPSPMTTRGRFDHGRSFHTACIACSLKTRKAFVQEQQNLYLRIRYTSVTGADLRVL